MGVDSLQEFVETECPDCAIDVDFKSCKFEEGVSNSTTNTVGKQKKRPQVLVAHADSCLRYLYPQHADWICGGQWSELLNNVEKFVRSFRQANVELVVFFEGSSGRSQIHDWRVEQTASREIIRKINNQVGQRYSYQSRKNFVSPACLKTVLRLAFRACSVLVCSSIDDVHEEIVSYCILQHCLGVLGNHPAYLLYNFPNYFSSAKLKMVKKSVATVRYEFDKVLQILGLSEDKLPLFASLLGNAFIPEGYLASFHWKLIDAEHPMKKLQTEGNLKYQSILPPNEVVIRGVSKYLQDKSEDDIESIVKDAFQETGYNLEEALERFKSSVEYYKKGLSAAKTKRCQDKDNETKEDGYPTHSFEKKADIPTGQNGNQEHSYQERWKQFKQLNTKPLVVNNKGKEDEKPKDEETTPDDAASALQQLDLQSANDNGNEKPHPGPESDVIVLPDEKPSVEQVTLDELSTQQHAQGLHGVTIGIPAEQKAPTQESTDVKVNGHTDSTKDVSSETSSVAAEASCQVTSKWSDNQTAPVAEDVLKVAKQRHQNGQMCPDIYKLLVKGEILLSMVLDDEQPKNRPPIALLYRPLRQLIYGILFDYKARQDEAKKSNGQTEEENVESPVVKEWVVHGSKNLLTPDLVEPKSMSWEIPTIKTLWFGRQPEDNNNRMKAFLTCLKSDTQSMTNTHVVPQRFLLLCCVLRYLTQQEKAIISQHDIDAFLAQALSPHLSIEQNSMNLANLKLNKIDPRPMYLASIFMSGIECAILANDACGSPVPWEFCCPWTFFDGKLFHSKWQQAAVNMPLLELCDSKAANVETVKRLRWVITEGLTDKYPLASHSSIKPYFSSSPFGPPPASLLPGPPGGRDGRIGGSFADHGPRDKGRGRGRGYPSKRPVPSTGGTLQVAGMPVAHWSGNKGGIGKKDAPDIVVGGLSSVDLPSSHRGKRNVGRGRPANRGRGLLPTPIVSPWTLDLDMPPTSIPIGQPIMAGGRNIPLGKGRMGVPRSNMKPRGVFTRPFSSTSSAGKTVSGSAAGKSLNSASNNQAPKLLTKSADTWVGTGRGASASNGPQSDETLVAGPSGVGRGHWQE